MTPRRIAGLAFRGRLNEASVALDRARSGIEPDEAAWLAAYIANARGEFEAAERLARTVLASDGAGRVTRARAAATLGSVLRQRGRHADARGIERAALRTAPRGETQTHLRIGLAADAVGLGELAAVDAALMRIGSRPLGGWRATVRNRWVRCERELLAGNPVRGARHARSALAVAESMNASRHVAKSFLFLGAALTGVGDDSGEADASLRRARRLASKIGARPIADVASELLGRSRPRR